MSVDRSTGPEPRGSSSPDGGFSVAVSRRDDGVILALEGDLDLASVANLRGKFAEVEEHDPPAVTLDLGGLRFIDSTGLRLIAELYQHSVQRRRALWLLPGPPHIQRLFEITLLDQTLPFVRE